ncbi:MULTISPECIES: SDR family NAD(P)-dependent oxidoreductase [Methylomonas]|uniref:Short-chain dehydrogenase n=1 Tax=Methylomonas koyamae TaxID=702114 RepID=A0A291IL73_9GAMM|nr:MULTISPECIES: SDR family NAD(P)-dependent oxidoreductase [Methylomonas]ANE56076.1 short-chain dehydrogenase [Methylomonas sp. DH-1]ATG90956.1 short-chain dehydrogenase [Methylomonas koyamae]OAI28934.1 short-chain dehydrogenase [Methylomonas koyamae]BBL58065.1 YciK family oxidoreductase [Methylomonas koyamae]
MPLKDHVILITGAGGGLGATAALALARHGAQIILLDKNIPKLERIYDAIVAAGAPEPVMYPFDLAGASEAQYQEMADAIEQRYGSLQGLLHSAVEFSAFSPIASYKTKDWGHALNVNLNAPFILCRVLLPLLQLSRHAAIVFTSDSAARKAQAYSGAYGVSKIALEGFAAILAAELEAGQKIRVNTLCPGPVDSPLRKRAYPAEDKTAIPPMSSLEPLYLYLFGDASIGVTGQIIDAQTFKP